MTLHPPADAPATRSIEELLEGSYWDGLSDDRDFMGAVHAYYAALKHPGEQSFYDEAQENLIRESNRVTKAKTKSDNFMVTATDLMGILSTAAINEKYTQITFPDEKPESVIYAQHVAREYHKTGESQRAARREGHNTHSEECFWR